MPSIGLALHAGRKMYEEDRREKEANDRLIAGRKLWDMQLKEQEAAVDILGKENQKARGALASIYNNYERVLAGDPTGTANVMNDVLYAGTDLTATVDPETGKIQTVNKEGKVVQTTDPMVGQQGLVALRALGETLTNQYASSVAAQQGALAAQRELEKVGYTKQWDRVIANDKNRADLSVAGTSANAAVNAAAVRGMYDLRGKEVAAQADIIGAQYANLPNIVNYNAALGLGATTGIPVGLSKETGLPVDAVSGTALQVVNPDMQQSAWYSQAGGLQAQAQTPYAAPVQPTFRGAVQPATTFGDPNYLFDVAVPQVTALPSFGLSPVLTTPTGVAAANYGAMVGQQNAQNISPVWSGINPAVTNVHARPATRPNAFAYGLTQ